jgi:pyruvate-formate lyase-activating enzyme
MIQREKLYRLPWSKTDNPGGWIEVTDVCDLNCPGCYRHQIEGHRPLDIIKKDINDLIRLTNCDCIAVTGGEPLGYPDLIEVIRYIASKKIKPMVFTNGLLLTPKLADDLKKAGLAKMHFHIDSAQERAGWTGKTETELNELRQYYADILRNTKKIQCGFHVTIFRSNLEYIPEILKWCQKNITIVHHISFLAYRAIAKDPLYQLVANGKIIDPEQSFGSNPEPNEINITTEEMYRYVLRANQNLRPSVYLNGTSVHETNKFLIIVTTGTSRNHLGVLGPKTMEMAQMFYHLFNGKYFAFLENPRPGKKLFFMSLFDGEIKKAFTNYLKASIKNPLRLFDKIYAQSIHLQQPIEVLDGMINLCDDCVNMMVYNGRLINSCRLDEYRMFGGPINIIKQNGSSN